MNASDLARLELAKRAFRATEASETEVQRGVRRARLALQRPKERRRWFGKGLVMVVLAVGSLAYAKPHAIGALFTTALGSSHESGKQLPARVGAVPAKAPEQAPVAQPVSALPAPQLEAAPAPPGAKALKSPAAHTPANHSAPPTLEPSDAPSNAEASSIAAKATTTATATEQGAMSDWGRVGQALAQGDESKALAVLGQLSESDDQLTRDKADLGRAQLLLSHGERDQACVLARSLTNRRAGSRIERQAQALLKSCSR
jgi:hypothetical protein